MHIVRTLYVIVIAWCCAAAEASASDFELSAPFQTSAGPLGQSFLARREAFFFAAFSHGIPFPYEYREKLPSPLSDESRSFLGGLVYELSVGGVESSCAMMANVVPKLAPDTRYEIDRYAYWEWPAEYFAYAQMKEAGLLDREAYRAMRHLTGDYELYRWGIFIGEAMEAIVSADDWPRQMAQGRGMISALEDWCTPRDSQH